MKSKIKARLKTLYSNKGLSEKTLDGVAEHLAKTVTKEEEIETACTGVEPFLTVFQSEADSLRTEANTQKQQFEAYKAANPEKKADPPKTDPPADPNANPLLAKMMETLEAMRTEITTLKTEKTVETLQGKFKALAEGEKIPEAFYATVFAGGRTFKDEAEMNAVFEAVKTNHATFAKKEANESFTEVPAVVTGFKSAAEAEQKKNEVSPLMANYLASKKPEAAAAK